MRRQRWMLCRATQTTVWSLIQSYKQIGARTVSTPVYDETIKHSCRCCTCRRNPLISEIPQSVAQRHKPDFTTLQALSIGLRFRLKSRDHLRFAAAFPHGSLRPSRRSRRALYPFREIDAETDLCVNKVDSGIGSTEIVSMGLPRADLNATLIESMKNKQNSN